MIKESLIKVSKIKNWIIITTIIFFLSLGLAGIVAILIPSLAYNIFSQFFAEIEEIGEEIFTAHPLTGIIQLFLNNFRASLVFIFGGLILAIPTLLGLILNGGAIGALAVLSTTLEGINPLFFILAIIPHGIIEIPAILISGSLGLKMGWQLIKPENNMGRLESIKLNLNLILRVLPLIILMLFVAAIIEIVITPFILDIFVDTNIHISN